MHKAVKSNIFSILVGLFAQLLAAQACWAQFAWDGDCSINWMDCCNYGTPENPDWHNNWTIEPSPTACPALPGVNDDVFAGGTILLTQSAHVNSLSVAGTFMFGGAFRSLLADTDLSITGTITEPTTLQIQGAYNIVQLWEADTTATVSPFATIEFQAGGAVYGPASSMLYNNGLIWKTAESVQPPGFPPLPPSLNIPVENNGTISCWEGTLTLAKGGTNNGVIEALGDGIVAFKGPATYVLDGEVRGDGLIRFVSTFSGGATTVTGNYHPTNTLVAGGYATVNFEVDTSIENLTIDNPGIVGGSADLTVDNLTWYGTTTMAPGGKTIVQDTALFQKDAPNNGSLALNRDMDLHGESTIELDTMLVIDDGALRNYGVLEMLGNSSIAQPCCTPDSVIENFGTLRKVSGAPSLINVEFHNIGEVAVESGSLEFGKMINDSGITVDTGATSVMAHPQQVNLMLGSITGPGTVTFLNDQHNPPVIDDIGGIYNVGTTTISGAQVEFQSDATTATLNMIGGQLLGDADFTVTDQLNWSAGEMAGTGTTFVHGPMTLNFIGYAQHLSRTLELNVDAPDGKQPPTSTLVINPLGVLHCQNVTIDGHVNNSGVISPGIATAPVGQLHLTGSYTQTIGGQLTLNKLGPVHDQLIVDGVATLSGTLNASGFPASGGQSYTILTAADVEGTFAQVNAPRGTTVVYTDTSVILQSAPGTPCPADLNSSGSVDGADLGILLLNWNSSGPGEFTGDRVINGADLGVLLLAWGNCP